MTLKATSGNVELFLKKRPELSHITIRTRGNMLTLESIDRYGNRCPHARLRKESIHKWSLEMPARKGWDSTFIEGTAEELMELLVEKFPWAVAIQ